VSLYNVSPIRYNFIYNKLTKEEQMSYAYNTRTNTKSKWDTIQEDVADQYAYLDDEVDVEDEELEDVELTDEQVDALLAEMAEVA
jgi:hypothetical protein